MTENVETINKTIIIGIINREPIISITNERKKDVVNLSLKTEETFVNPNGEKITKSEYHRVVIWNKNYIERCKDLKIGDRIYVEGKIKTKKMFDKDAKPMFTTEIIATELKKM